MAGNPRTYGSLITSTSSTMSGSQPVEDPFGDPMATPDGGGTGTIIVERPETADVEAGDHERFAHYVRKEKIVESAVMGSPVIALCGKVWVPNRDPGRFPVCPECQEIYESMPPGDDSGEGSS